MEEELGLRTVGKVKRRLLPLMALLFVIAFIDRVNVGYAALSMNSDLGFTGAVYGTGAGIFFIGYFLFEIPSNLALHRFGARRWIARIMFTWGVIAMGMALVQGQTSFYVVRFLLGAAEAGFYPGMILYITYWFPRKDRNHAIALFAAASPIATIIGAPISGVILDQAWLNGLWSLKPWQWLFVVEGIPAIVLGFVALRYLTDKPSQATWLTLEERAWLIDRQEAEAAELAGQPRMNVAQVLSSGRIWFTAVGYFTQVITFYGLVLWLPLIISGFGGLSKTQVTLISALPYVCAVIAAVSIGRSSDRMMERKWHLVIPALVGVCGFTGAALVRDPYMALLGVCVGQAGLWAANNMFWALPSAFLTGVTAAAAIAFINAFANLGGFVGPFAVGWIKDQTGSFQIPMFVLAACLLAYAVMMYILHGRLVREGLMPARNARHVPQAA